MIFSTIQKTLDTLHSDNKATNSRIDNLLVDAFKQAFGAAKATKPTAGDIHRTDEIISIAGKAGVKLDPTILSEYGHWVSTLSKQPSLSNVAFHSLNEAVSYRSFLNADVAPKFSDARKLAPQFDLNFIPLPPPPNTHANVIPGFLLWAHGGASPEQAAKIYKLSKPSPEISGGRFEFFIIDGEGGTIILDDQGMKNVIIQNSVIKYGGGPVRLENVYFVNCTFKFELTPRSRELGNVLLTSAATTFVAGG